MENLKENLKVAKRGGGVAKGAKDLYEKETKKSAISKSNRLSYKYIDEIKHGVRIDIWTHLMRGCIMNYVH